MRLRTVRTFATTASKRPSQGRQRSGNAHFRTIWNATSMFFFA